MSASYYKAIRSDSLLHLQKILTEAKMRGWEAIGEIDMFDAVYVQPIKLTDYDDVTTEVIIAKVDK